MSGIVIPNPSEWSDLMLLDILYQRNTIQLMPNGVVGNNLSQIEYIYICTANNILCH